jgi:biopolymer transport protein ExbB
MSSHRFRLLLLTAVFCALALTFGRAAESATPPDEAAARPAAAATQVGQKSLLDVYLVGGSLMHFILACSIGTIAGVVYCFLSVNRRRMMPPAEHQNLIQYARHQDIQGAWQLCETSPSAYARVISPALLKLNPQRDQANKSAMEQAAGEAIDREEARQMLWINYLNVFATIAPMLGLLGTVTGMIASFDTLAAGKSEPQDLAGGIGEAMTTTASGLIVGIPAMFFYFFFKNRLASLMSEIQKNASFTLDVLSGELNLGDGDPRS